MKCKVGTTNDFIIPGNTHVEGGQFEMHISVGTPPKTGIAKSICFDIPEGYYMEADTSLLITSCYVGWGRLSFQLTYKDPNTHESKKTPLVYEYL